MNDSSAGGAPASVRGSDADLLNTIRSGDPRPYEVLRARHATAARSLAIHLPGGPDAADHVVDLTFRLVLDAIRDGGGPSDAFRPYLLTAVRRVARDVARGSSASFPTDEQQISDPGQPLRDPGAPGPDGSPVVAAFLSLPERWRAVLWHAEVERAAPAQAGLFLGLPAAAVAELTGQARDGLERAYLQLQKAGAGPEVASIPDVGAALRGTVAPTVLGEATAAYLADTVALSGSAGPESTMTAGSARTAYPGRSGGPARSGGSGTRRQASRHAGRPAALTSMATRLSGTSVRQRALAGGAGALLGIVAVAVAVLTLGNEAGTATAAGDRQPGPPSVTASGPATSPAADSGASGGSGSPHPSPGTGQPGSVPPGAATPAPQPTTHPPVTQGSPPPDPAPVRSRPPSAQLTAQVSVLGPGMFGHLATVSFGIGDSGPGSSGTLTASIFLPSGSTPVTGWRMPGPGGWSCTADSGGLSCSHEPIAASDRTGGLVAVMVTGSAACGQPVRVTVSGGASVSTAESAATIECGQSQHARSDAARTVEAGGISGLWWPGISRMPGRAHDLRARGWLAGGWRTQNWHSRDQHHSRYDRGRDWH